MTEPLADATADDALIEPTDNTGDPGTAEVTQDPAVEIQSETTDPPEVTS